MGAQTFTQNLTGTQLSLDDAVSLALDNNLNLKKNQIDLAASSFSERNLWAEIFPTINASGRAGYSSPLFSDIESPAHGFSYRIGFGFNLGLNAGIPFSMKSIKLAHQSNLLRYEEASTLLSIQVTKRFYSLIAEKNNLLLLEEVLNLAHRQYERNQVSFRNGLIRELTLIQSRLAVENARYSLSTANTVYMNNMLEFLAVLGIASDTETTLSGEINIIKIDADAETLIKHHLLGRPDITRSRQEIERLENSEIQSIIQNRAPSLNLSMEWASSTFNPFADTWSSTATLNIPVDSWIPGTSRSQSIGRTSDAVEKARLDLTLIEDTAKTQIRSLTALLRNSWDSVVIARLSLEAAQHSYQLTDEAFRNGTVESLVLEDARNNMTNTRQRLLQTELAYFIMILDLSAAINMDWKHFIQNYGIQEELNLS
jgi:multidrug efflux system outer membrane protein